jgi:hypothetical protein
VAGISAPDNVYWTFSAAAQALAAVVAFLLAGYALVHSMMESRAASDETLLEINDKLSQDYHRRLSALIIVTIAAILADLVAVYINRCCVPAWLQLLAASLTVLSFGGAVWFVISIVDPAKYKRAARQMAERPTGEVTGPRDAAEVFFREFVQIERLLQTLWESRTDARSRRRGWYVPSAREMVESLRKIEVLPGDMAEKLQKLVRTRNLVFHGQVEYVDSDQVQNARWVKDQLHRLVGPA